MKAQKYLRQTPTERDVADVFDAWYEEQPEDVQLVVDYHLEMLMGSIKMFGPLSAKMLLAQVYGVVASCRLQVEGEV